MSNFITKMKFTFCIFSALFSFNNLTADIDLHHEGDDLIARGGHGGGHHGGGHGHHHSHSHRGHRGGHHRGGTHHGGNRGHHWNHHHPHHWWHHDRRPDWNHHRGDHWNRYNHPWHDWYWYGNGGTGNWANYSGTPGYTYDPNYYYYQDGIPTVEYQNDIPEENLKIQVVPKNPTNTPNSNARSKLKADNSNNQTIETTVEEKKETKIYYDDPIYEEEDKNSKKETDEDKDKDKDMDEDEDEDEDDDEDEEDIKEKKKTPSNNSKTSSRGR